MDLKRYIKELIQINFEKEGKLLDVRFTHRLNSGFICVLKFRDLKLNLIEINIYTFEKAARFSQSKLSYISNYLVEQISLSLNICKDIKGTYEYGMALISRIVGVETSSEIMVYEPCYFLRRYAGMKKTITVSDFYCSSEAIKKMDNCLEGLESEIEGIGAISKLPEVEYHKSVNAVNAFVFNIKRIIEMTEAGEIKKEKYPVVNQLLDYITAMEKRQISDYYPGDEFWQGVLIRMMTYVDEIIISKFEDRKLGIVELFNDYISRCKRLIVVNDKNYSSIQEDILIAAEKTITVINNISKMNNIELDGTVHQMWV